MVSGDDGDDVRQEVAMLFVLKEWGAFSDEPGDFAGTVEKAGPWRLARDLRAALCTRPPPAPPEGTI